MPSKGKDYGNASQVTVHVDDYGGMRYADGGIVNPQGNQNKEGMPRPKRGGKPKKIEGKGSPGGPHTPGAKGTYPPKKMADGGKAGKKMRKNRRQQRIDRALKDAGA